MGWLGQLKRCGIDRGCVAEPLHARGPGSRAVRFRNTSPARGRKERILESERRSLVWHLGLSRHLTPQYSSSNRRRDLAMHDLATVIDGVWVLKLGAAFEV